VGGGERVLTTKQRPQQNANLIPLSENTMTDEILYFIGLTKIPKVGAITARNLVSYCGGAEAVFKAKKKLLLSIPGIGASMANLILKQDVLH